MSAKIKTVDPSDLLHLTKGFIKSFSLSILVSFLSYTTASAPSASTILDLLSALGSFVLRLALQFCQGFAQ